jgi:hypothetical protein
MTIEEVVGRDPLKSELDRNRKAQQTLKVRKAQIRTQQAQQQLRAVKAPTKP